MKKILLALALAGIIFNGCKPKEEAQPGPGSRQPGAKLRFAFIPKSLTIPVFAYAKIGAERKAEQLGNVEIIWRAPDIIDAIKQKEILESFIAQRVDGIAISCMNSALVTPSINKAVEMGIPVVTWDSDAPRSKRAAFYGVNDFESGVIMGDNLVKLLDGKGKITVITTLGADNLEQRLKGVMSVLQKNPGIEVMETFDCKDDYLAAKQYIEIVTKSHPELTGMISTGGWPVFNENILNPVDTTRVKVVAFDTIPPAPDVMKKGKAQILIGQKYFGWGAVPTQILYDIVVNKKYPPDPIIYSGVDVVTPENVDAYIQKWNKMASGEIFE